MSITIWPILIRHDFSLVFRARWSNQVWSTSEEHGPLLPATWNCIAKRFLEICSFFHRDVGRKMLAFRASKDLLLGAVLFLFYDTLQTSKPLKEEKTHLVASRRGSQHTRRAMKSIWLFSCLMLFSPCCSRTSTRLPLECTTDRLSRMASNGYDILLLEAQDRLSSNDLEGTGRGGAGGVVGLGASFTGWLVWFVGRCGTKMYQIQMWPTKSDLLVCHEWIVNPPAPGSMYFSGTGGSGLLDRSAEALKRWI